MKILGISNPNFTGVTIATKANCTHYLPVPHMQSPGQMVPVIRSILNQKPDLMIVGGWSKGYLDMLRALHPDKTFPVVSVYHSSLFHGSFFGDDVYWREFERAQATGVTDILGFVQPQMAEYYQIVRKKKATAFVPHCFLPQKKVEAQETFNIGVFGDTEAWHKNVQGVYAVAKDFAERNPNCKVIRNFTTNSPHEEFLRVLAQCSVVIHASHLECYPNVIQECWVRGIPVISSPASDGLTIKNPLYPTDEFVLNSATDVMEIYRLLGMVHRNWEGASIAAFNHYKRLSELTTKYNDKLFSKIVEGYNHGIYDTTAFSEIFGGTY